MAADQGHADAQYSLGRKFRSGGGAFWHYEKEAVRWLRLAVDRGHLRAQMNLAEMYRKGHGVRQVSMPYALIGHKVLLNGKKLPIQRKFS